MGRMEGAGKRMVGVPINEKLNALTSKISPARQMFPANTEIASSLTLQVVLYYHFVYSLAWFAIQLHQVPWKLANLDLQAEHAVMLPLFLALWGISQGTRLMFGYIGNLREKVPRLLGFLILTLIPHLPLTIYFLVFQPSRKLYDIVASAILAVFAVLEILLGMRTIRKLTRSHKAKFYFEGAMPRVHSGAEQVHANL